MSTVTAAPQIMEEHTDNGSRDIIEQNYQVHGNQNIIGDYNTLNTFEYSIVERTDFFEPNLTQFSPPAYHSPPFANTIVTQVVKQRLLIIGGHPSIDKGEIARHIAWRLCQNHVASSAESEAPPVQEWSNESDSQGLDISLREAERPSIFILPKLSPDKLGYDPSLYRSIAQKKNHYVIASSDVAFEVWKMPSEQQSLFWFEVTPDLYPEDYLTQVLRAKLIESRNRLPKSLANLDWENRPFLVDDIPLAQVASQLKIPSNLDVFIDFICGEVEPDAEIVAQILLRTVDHEVGLRQWYYQLKPRQQLLTAALNFFDGLFDDQLFASLDRLVETVWRQREPMLVSFDYYDLEGVKSIYNFVQTDNGRVKVENRSPERRQALLQMAWQSHRRYILATLNQLAQLVIDSAPNRSANFELYGTELKQEHIRAVIGGTLSNLGLISVGAIEQTLLRLASDKHPYVQSVAATAMAHWRISGHDKALFETLYRWQTEAKVLEFVDRLIEEREEERYDGYAYIRSTVALAVAFAAAYDRPHQLSDALHDLVKELAFDPNGLVRQRFLVYTLPRVVSQHWRQLEKTLRDFVIQVDLIPSIGVSLAQAYRTDPEGIVGLLDEWQNHASQLKVRPRHRKPHHREGILAAVALTYGYLPYYARIGSLTAEMAFQKLKQILANENEHPFVRIAVIRSISLMTQKRFADIEPYLRDIVQTIHQPEEQAQVVDIIKDLFIKQRAKLEGGERRVTVQGTKYAIWLKEPRPLTEVEEAMLQWVNQADNQKAQEIGLQAQLAFAGALSMALVDEIERIKEQSRTATPTTQAAPQSTTAQVVTNLNRSLNKLSLFQRLLTWIATIGVSDPLRKIIRGLVPEAMARYQEERVTLEFVLNGWQYMKGEADVNMIAVRLRRALRLINGTALKAVAILGLIFLCGVCSLLL